MEVDVAEVAMAVVKAGVDCTVVGVAATVAVATGTAKVPGVVVASSSQGPNAPNVHSGSV